MRINVRLNEATRLVNCGMVILVSCGYKDKRNVTTCAWHTVFSKKPPLLGIALAKPHFSSELIRKSEEFAVNIPAWNILDKVILAGRVSGWSVDKFKEIPFSSVKSTTLKYTPIIEECIGFLECSLQDIKEVGDHYLFVGLIRSAYAEETFFSSGFWDTTKVSFIFHLGAHKFFKSSPYVEL